MNRLETWGCDLIDVRHVLSDPWERTAIEVSGFVGADDRERQIAALWRLASGSIERYAIGCSGHALMCMGALPMGEGVMQTWWIGRNEVSQRMREITRMMRDILQADIERYLCHAPSVRLEAKARKCNERIARWYKWLGFTQRSSDDPLFDYFFMQKARVQPCV